MVCKKRSVLFFMLLLGVIFSLSFVIAQPFDNNITFVSPSSGAVLSQVASFNITNSSSAMAVGGIVNCTFYIKSSLTANNSWVVMGTASNMSISKWAINITYNTTYIEDSNDYQINVTCANITTPYHYWANISSVTIDNTVPTALILSPTTESSFTAGGTQTFTITVTDSKTTSGTYKLARGGLSSNIGGYTAGSMVCSGSSCTFTKSFSSESDNGAWNWQSTVSDESNTTSVGGILNVKIASVGGLVSGSQNIMGGKSIQTDSKTIGLWILGIFGVIGIGYLIFRRK